MTVNHATQIQATVVIVLTLTLIEYSEQAGQDAVALQILIFVSHLQPSLSLSLSLSLSHSSYLNIYYRYFYLPVYLFISSCILNKYSYV